MKVINAIEEIETAITDCSDSVLIYDAEEILGNFRTDNPERELNKTAEFTLFVLLEKMEK